MRGLLRWTAGLVGIAALAKLLSRRRRRQAPAQPLDPADELRAKLAATREPSPEPETEPASLAERRARVHEQAQHAIDEMREEDP